MIEQNDCPYTAEALAAIRRAIARRAEHAEDTSQARNGFEAYWAGSVSASVLRDYHAARVTTVQATGR